MQTKRLYDEDSYIREFDASVISCEPCKEGYCIVLDQTAFFPEQGGQYADKGVISDANVLDVRIKNDIITHITDKPLELNASVHGKIDWELRYSNMQNHSGEHLVSGFVNKTWGFDNVGFHLGYDEVTLDFNGTLTEEDIELIENTVNNAIYENIDTVITFPTAEELAALSYRSKKELTGQVRIVEFPGYDICACCAPHVKKTGEIGMIKITGFYRFKKGTRVSILCGTRALQDFRKKQSICETESKLLSAKVNEVDQSVIKLKTDYEKLRYEFTALSAERLNSKALSTVKQACDETSSESFIATSQGKFIYLIDDFNNETTVVRNAVNLMIMESHSCCAIFTPNADKSAYSFIMGCEQGDVREIMAAMKAVNPAFAGGGTASMIQGTAKLNHSDLLTVIRSCN